jgi:hypothetical protein
MLTSMNSGAKTVSEYLDWLPPDRKPTIEKLRAVIRKHLPKGYEETLQYGMLSYVVPKSIYPPGYHVNPEHPLAYLSLGAQKNHYALYLMTASWPLVKRVLETGYAEGGKKLDMGQACIRFKGIEDLPLDVITAAIAMTPVDDNIAFYKQSRAGYAATKAQKKAATKTKAAPAPASAARSSR